MTTSSPKASCTETGINASAPPAPSADSDLTRLSAAVVESQRLNRHFLRPAYGSFCFAGIPGFFERVLCGHTDRPSLPIDSSALFGREFRQVVFVFFDAFGWESFERFADRSPFLQAFRSHGAVAKLTSQFPSTTAAHVTTMCAGVPVYESAVCEWFYFEPRADAVINPFRLNRQGERAAGTLLSEGLSGSDILPSRSFFRDLHGRGVVSRLYGPSGYFPSSYSEHFYDKGSIYGYQSISAGLEQLITFATRSAGPAFHYFYIDTYDTICHNRGPCTADSDRIARTILTTLEQLLSLTVRKDTLIVLTADHGQVQVPPETEIILNRVFPSVVGALARTASGELIRFGGSPRDLLLYTQPGAAQQLADDLRKALSGAAEVLTRDEAAALGILGPLPLHTNFVERIGDVIVLPYRGHSVAWHDPPNYSRHFNHGHHGGLTPEEMEIPLLLLGGE